MATTSSTSSSQALTTSSQFQQSQPEKQKYGCTQVAKKALAFASDKEKAIRISAGSVIRDAFFFPLHASPKIYDEQLGAAEKRFKDFWDLNTKPNSIYARHWEIREHFTPPEKRDVFADR